LLLSLVVFPESEKISSVPIDYGRDLLTEVPGTYLSVETFDT
jgi:hypothetical protein